MPMGMPTDQRVTDALIAVGVFALSVAVRAAMTSGHDGVESIGVLTIALLALSSLPLALRRRAPLAVFVVTALASIALNGIEGSGPPLGATLALYWLAAGADGSRARDRLVLGLVVVLLAAHAAAGGLERGAFPGSELLFGGLVWGGAWLAGDRTRLRHERMAELEERARHAEQEANRERRLAAAEERARIARDLHDSAGHAINVILVHAGLGRMLAEDDPAGARAELETIEQVARETIGEIDQLVGAMREEARGGNGGVEPPAGLAALDGLVERHRQAGLEVSVRRDGEGAPLPSSVDRAAYRILQEALTNASRHGDGTASIEIERVPGLLRLRVANPFTPDGGDPGGGHGLVGMRERAGLLGGELDAGPNGRRFEVRARLPVVEATR